MARLGADQSAGRRVIGGRSVRWDETRARQAYADGLWSRETLAAALKIAAERTPDRTVLIEGEARLDCRTLARQAQSLAQALLTHAEPGSVISFMLPNWHEAAVIYFAAAMAGMVVHPVLPQLRERELAHMLADAESRMIFIPQALRGRDYAVMLESVCAGLPSPPRVVVLRGPPRQGQLAYDALTAMAGDAPPPDLDLDPDAVHMVLYTSGTTGLPKGVAHSQNSLRALVRQLGEHWLIAPGDVFLVPSPISHIGGSIYAFELPVLLGTTAVLMEQWDADAAVGIARATPFTHIAGATPFLEQLLAAAVRAESRLPDLKVFICGGAAVPPSLIEAAAARFEKAVVTRVYGSTEVPVTTVGTMERGDLAHAAQTDGGAGYAEIKLVPSAAAAQADEGEIYARAPQMLVGYLHPEDEAEVFDAEGFYRTGDLGRWVDDRFLVVSGRAKDIIIRSGENISPKEVEDALRSHPAVADVAIVGLPDPKTGERACAVVVARPGTAPDLATLAAFLREAGFASFKLPEQVEVWPDLPRNATGKVLKHEIRARLAAATER